MALNTNQPNISGFVYLSVCCSVFYLTWFGFVHVAWLWCQWISLIFFVAYQFCYWSWSY